jgi:hypothetical protein
MNQEWRLVPVELLESIEKSWRVPDGCPESIREDVRRIIGKGLFKVREILAAAPVPPEDDFKIACDFCATEVDYEPWHGSGLLNGVVSRHVHACNNCRALLPLPPAGGEVEVLGWRMDEASGDLNGCYREEPVWQYLGKPEAYKVTKLTDYSHVTRLQAENAALQQRLNVADQRIDELEKDKRRLDSLESNFWDVRHHSTPLADTGDSTTSVEIIGHWMDKPHERVIGENYNENLRAAIDQAMTADAYPPARPEYPEIDAALSEENWRMNPCKLGHRDVGACGGEASCYTCDETITAATTQEAFEQWNASHPAISQ